MRVVMQPFKFCADDFSEFENSAEIAEAANAKLSQWIAGSKTLYKSKMDTRWYEILRPPRLEHGQGKFIWNWKAKMILVEPFKAEGSPFVPKDRRRW